MFGSWCDNDNFRTTDGIVLNLAASDAS